MTALGELLPWSQSILWAGLAVFVRVSAMMATLPVFGEQTVPLRLRLALTLAFTLVVLPAVSTPPVPVGLGPALSLLGPEVIVGLFYGLMLRFFIFALQIAGAIAAQSTSLSQIFGGSAGVDPQPAMGRVLLVAGLALAALMGLHVQIAAYMINSYLTVPLGVLVDAEIVMSLGITEVSRTFALGFTLAAPFVIASLIYNVTLGVINRAMPQLMVSFIGAPAITAGGLLLLLIVAPVLLGVWLTAFANFMENPFSVIR